MKQWAKNKAGRGIEWCDETDNPVGGCFHRCRWHMPNGVVAICYAENLALNGVAKAVYQNGFEHHYWRPEAMKSWGQKIPKFIFPDSMSDLMGHWVPAEQRAEVFENMRRNPQHTFQLLTKAAPQYLKVLDILPPNVWAGASMPPDHMMGNPVRQHAQVSMFKKTLDVLAEVKAKTGNVTWISFEPLSWDVSEVLAQHPHSLDWAVIGAATDGVKKFQPVKEYVTNLLRVCDEKKTAVFFKGNLDWEPRREDFPVPPSPYDAAVRQRQKNAMLYGWPLNTFLPVESEPEQPAGAMPLFGGSNG